MLKGGFKHFSVGIVAKDKERGNNKIYVFPIEHLGEHTGKLTDTEDKDASTLKFDGTKQSIKATKEVTIEASWRDPSGSNRITAPDVKAGETVQIYKYGSTDKYYWTSEFKESDLRRKESVVWGWGNTEEHGEQLDITKMYWMKVDTVAKLLQLFTVDNDGELTTYDIKIDTKNGVLHILDGRKNKIEINSKENNISIEAQSTINLKAGKEINIEAPTINQKAKNNIVSGGHLKVNSTTSFHASVKCNKNCNTEPKSGEPHAHAVL